MTGKDGPGGQRHRRVKHTGKRFSFQWINGQIISAADYGGLENLLEVVSTHLEHMNLVNLSTAIHRLAKLSSRDPAAQAKLLRQPAMQGLLVAVEFAFSGLEAGEAQPQSLSNVAWSLATMRLAPRALIQVMASLAVSNIPVFKPFELSTILWAFAKLSASDGESSGVNVCIKPLFYASGAHILKHGQHFAFRCLATTAWAFATARQHNARLFRAIAAQMVPMVHAANCQEMANTAWAFGTTDFRDDRLFGELADKAMTRLCDFKPQELSNILWGFATNGFFHEAFFAAAAQVATTQLDLQAQHIANILWSFARVRPRHPVTQATVLALLPCCISQLETFKPQEVSSSALAVAKAFGRPDAFDAGSGSFEGPSPTPEEVQLPLPLEVQEFFTVVMMWVISRLHEFSVQSLANTVSAYTLIDMPGVEVLLSAAAAEVHSRYDHLEPTSMLHLLKGFASAPSCRAVVNALAAGLAPRVDELRPQEMQVLSRICAGLLGLRHSGFSSTEELRNHCAALGAGDLRAVAEVAHTVVLQANIGRFWPQEDEAERYGLELERFEYGNEYGETTPTYAGVGAYDDGGRFFDDDPWLAGRFFDDEPLPAGRFHSDPGVYSSHGRSEARVILSDPLAQELAESLQGKRGGGGRVKREEGKDAKRLLCSINESKQSGQNATSEVTNHAKLLQESHRSSWPQAFQDMQHIPWKDPPKGCGEGPRVAWPGDTGNPVTFRWSVKNTFVNIRQVHHDGRDLSDVDTMEGSLDGDASQRSSSVPSRLDHEDWRSIDEDLKDNYLPKETVGRKTMTGTPGTPRDSREGPRGLAGQGRKRTPRGQP